MPFEAAKELRKDRVSGDGNENSESHLRHAEKNYVEIAKKYNWHYINCLKTKKYTKLEDIKSIDEIAGEIDTIVDKLLKEKNEKINKLTKF